MAHVSLITLGVDDLASATRFYEALGWQRSSASVDGEVAFLRGGAVVLGLFGREDLAAEAGVPPGSGEGTSVALAMNVPSEAAVDETLATAVRAGGDDHQRGPTRRLGRVLGLRHRPRRTPVGGRAQPVLRPAPGRPDRAS